MCPYFIRKLPNKNLYKVYDNSGIPLSQKGLSKKKAEKQKIAVLISESKRKKRLNK